MSQPTRQQQIAALEKDWAENPRWKGIQRGYTAADVVRLRGSVQIEHTLARRGAEKLWALCNGGAAKGYVNAFGAITAGQAMQQAKAGLEAVYLSGWQVAADGNTSDSRTHIETWSALRALAGRADFLYVADSKLCSRENMDFSTARADASSPCYPAIGWRTRSFAPGSRPTPPSGSMCGTAPMRAVLAPRETAGSSGLHSCPRPRAGPWSGCGAPCSRCARRHAGGVTSPRPPKSLRAFACVWPAPRHGYAVPPRSTCRASTLNGMGYLTSGRNGTGARAPQSAAARRSANRCTGLRRR